MIVKPEVFTKFQKRPGLSHINRLFYFTLHRCVPDNQRSYSLGFQFIFQRSLGFMPGPVVTGWIFDYLCLLWGESCGKRGRCQIYDIKKLSLAITVLGCIMKGKVSVSEAIVTAIIDRVNTGQLLIYSIMEDKKHSTLLRSICNCMRINLLCIKQATLDLSPPNQEFLHQGWHSLPLPFLKLSHYHNYSGFFAVLWKTPSWSET